LSYTFCSLLHHASSGAAVETNKGTRMLQKKPV
jgi:hypothetical protein